MKKNNSNREWVVSADILLPVIVSVQARNAEEAIAKVEAMSPDELHALWSGDTSSIGVSVDGADEGEA